MRWSENEPSAVCTQYGHLATFRSLTLFQVDSAEPEIKRNNQILPVLASWYRNQYPSQTAKNRKNYGAKRKRDDEGAKTDSQSPIVIIIEDFEGFGTHILQDFILNLR